jgi:hypothetical protein
VTDRKIAAERPLLLARDVVAVDIMSACDLRIQLGRLMAERLDATEAGLGDNATYMTDLAAELAAARQAYVGCAVTEIATLRGQLSGRQLG